jgi:hypothetical protein
MSPVSIRLLSGLGRHGSMMVADLLDLAVHDLHHFSTDRFNFAALQMGAVKKTIRPRRARYCRCKAGDHNVR